MSTFKTALIFAVWILLRVVRVFSCTFWNSCYCYSKCFTCVLRKSEAPGEVVIPIIYQLYDSRYFFPWRNYPSMTKFSRKSFHKTDNNISRYIVACSTQISKHTVIFPKCTLHNFLLIKYCYLIFKIKLSAEHFMVICYKYFKICTLNFSNNSEMSNRTTDAASIPPPRNNFNAYPSLIKFDNYYDSYCTNGVTVLSEKNVLIGSFYIFEYLFYLSLYIPILIVIRRSPLYQHTSYKLMFAIGTFGSMDPEE